MGGAPWNGDRVWFSDEERAGLEDFWRVYGANLDALDDAAMASALEDPRFGAIVRNLSEEELVASRLESRARLVGAMSGEWDGYDAHLREQGIAYARLGVPYTSWYRLARGVARTLSPLLFDAYGADPVRLSAATLAMQSFFDRAMAAIGEAYLDEMRALVRAQEEDLAITLDSIGDAFVATDMKGRVTRMNPVAEEVTGWVLADVKGRPAGEVVRLYSDSPGEATTVRLESALDPGAGPARSDAVVALARDGRRTPVSCSVSPIRGPDGSTRGSAIVLRDMSAQRAAEDARRRSDARFRRLRDAGVLGVIVTDTTGTILDANDTFLEMVGYTRTDLEQGRVRWTEMTPPEWRHLDEIALRELSEDGSFRTFEKEYIRKDGSRVSILLGGAMIEDDQVIAYILDITQQKRLEEFRARSVQLEAENRRIQEASRMKSEFLANMSHELRTPLNAIIGFASLLYDGEVDPDTPEHREFLGDILTSGRHLLQLINDVLDLSKVEAGKLDFHPESTDVAEVANEVVGILRTVAADKRIGVSVDVAEDVRHAVIDASRLKQVLYNYLSNALKFTDEGGRVTVRARSEGAGAFRVEVEDTGIGIAEDDLDRLFTEFQQLDTGLTKRHAGTGLGLALTRRLVEAQGGTVGVTSEPGVGSSFHAVLPRLATSRRPKPGSRVFAGAHAGAPTVLVIEDDERDQDTIVRALTEAGFSVTTAATGAQALARCRERSFDAITLDLLLPDVSGLDVLRGIRSTLLNRDVPVVVVTVVNERGALGGGAVHDILPKPVDPNVLLASLERVGVGGGSHGDVLIVDDDPGCVRLMQASLDALSVVSRAANRAVEALALARSAPPAAVVLDLVMPEMDGFEFLERFRELPGCGRVPVLVWTVKDLTAADRARLMEAAQGVLSKGDPSGASLVVQLRSLLPGIADRAKGGR